MKFRVLSASPVVFVAFAFVALHFVQSSPSYAGLLQAEIAIVKIASLIGYLVAALSLERGEHLRRAWLALAIGTALLLVRDALHRLLPPSGAMLGVSPSDVRGALLIVANLVSVLGAWEMARTFHLAGIEPPGSPRKRAMILGGAIVLAVVITGPSLWADGVKLMHGSAARLPNVIASVCDLVGFCLIAPVLLTALAFRGGVLYFPWALLVASQVGWLLYDVMGTIGSVLPIAAATALTITEICRALACTYSCAAGLAQRAVVTHDPGAVADLAPP